jgi:peptidylprolyl isomerase
MFRPVRPLLGALALTLTVAACTTGVEVASPTRTILPTTTSTTVMDCSPTTPVTPAAGKPTVTVPPGDAPTALVSTDITVGTGAEAKEGDKVAMQYVGVSKATGKEFDSSWSRNAEPFTFTIGPDAQVIKGWNQGIPGMKVGGRRELIIPADLAYGANPPGTDIAANDTLVFVVDLVQVCTPQTTPGTTPGSTPGSTPETVTPGSTPGAAGGSESSASTTTHPPSTIATTTTAKK